MNGERAAAISEGVANRARVAGESPVVADREESPGISGGFDQRLDLFFIQPCGFFEPHGLAGAQSALGERRVAVVLGRDEDQIDVIVRKRGFWICAAALVAEFFRRSSR